MGITKLLHIKQRKKGNKAQGLINCIDYILNPKKTQNKRLIGGNCGTDEEEVYLKFLNTKRQYGKTEGRQGYHYIISFPPEENVPADLCMNIASEFVSEYLKDEYDVVYSVHDDTEHMHAHILFNSVNSITGKKYRYEDGDWEKYIQPITDKIAEKYGLAKLEFVKAEDEDKSVDWKKVIMEDISQCIIKSENYQDFLNKMKQEYGYNIRDGFSKIKGYYISFKPPGARKAMRSYRLPLSCQPWQIEKRIQGYRSNNISSPEVKRYGYGKAYIHGTTSYVKWNNMSDFQKSQMKKIYEARRLYNCKTHKNWQNERVLRDINTQMKNYTYMQLNNIYSLEVLEQQKALITNNLQGVNAAIRSHRKTYGEFIYGKPSAFKLYEEYVAIKRKNEITAEDVQMVDAISEQIELNYVSEMYNEYYDKLNMLYDERKKLKKEQYRIKQIKASVSLDAATPEEKIPTKEKKQQKEKVK